MTLSLVIIMNWQINCVGNFESGIIQVKERKFQGVTIVA